MLRLSNQPILCMRCARRRQSLRAWRQAASSAPARLGNAHERSLRAFNTSLRSERPVTATTSKSSQTERPEAPARRSVPIRQYLRDWASENGLDIPPEPLPPDSSTSARVGNIMSRPQATGSTELDTINFETSDIDQEGSVRTEHWEDDSDHLSIENHTRTPGDLVELSPRGSRTSLFAIFLGYIGGLNHFYGSNGRWIMSRGFASRFSVAKFSTPNEIDPVLAQIPKDGHTDSFEHLRASGQGPSMKHGRHLVAKMAGFTTKVKGVYQNNITRLDNAQALTAAVGKTKYLSLTEISELILPASVRENGAFPPYVLYAVHLALFRHEVGFSPMSPSTDSHRRDHIFEILSQDQLNALDTVVAMVRDHMQKLVSKDPQTESTQLSKFIKQAKDTVHASRRRRNYAADGMLVGRDTTQQKSFSASAKQVINFLEQWAAHEIFDDGSKYHAYGSLVLRFLGLYNDAKLDQRTAWNFLQEVGWIQPWEIPSRYKTRLPGTRTIAGAGLDRDVPRLLADSERQDCAQGQRRDWGETPVFCIDAASTIIIDDGISLERTETPGEYWIHVHAADPASGITPKSDLGSFMELIPENIYLPGHFQAMFPSGTDQPETGDYQSQVLSENFSLKAGSRALTFSAKVNEDGEILDCQVQPSRINNVVYITPEQVARFCGEPETPQIKYPHKTLEVGEPPVEKMQPNRDMVSPEVLDEASQEDMRTLSRLSQALHEQRLAKGAWPYFLPGLSISVSGDKVEEADGQQTGKEPHIKISQDTNVNSSMVTNCMILGGQVAAQWCSERGIPVPYRKDGYSASNVAEALAYAQNEVYPVIKSGMDLHPGLRANLMQLTGPSQISDTPGPYFIMGVDKYTKATSPLRRYGDLIVHWQIHAALAFERQHKRQVNPSRDDLDTILPFTSEEVPNTFALLQTREKMCKTIAQGAYDWLLIALYRAWRVERNAPSKFTFTVQMKWRHSFSGAINLFNLKATLQVRDMGGMILSKDVNVGDRFDVELQEINVPNRVIIVRALRHYPQKPEKGSTTAADAKPERNADRQDKLTNEPAPMNLQQALA